MAAEFPAPHRLLAAALVQLGDANGAIRPLGVGAVDSLGAGDARLARACPRRGWRPVAGPQRPRHLNALSHTRYVSRYHSALAWTGVGDFDSAFASLSCACDERDPALMMLTHGAAILADARRPALRPLIDRLGFDREIAVHV